MTTGKNQPQDRWPPLPGSTGNPEVDRILAGLGDIGSLPVPQQVEAYAGIHDRLLAELDTEQD